MHGRVFGEGRKVRLRLLDIEACVGALQGFAMEIQDCNSDLVTEVVATSDPEVAFKGADVAVLLGGFPRLPGMERRDLIAKNVPIMAEHGRALAKCAKDGVRVLVVANPACTNCLMVTERKISPVLMNDEAATSAPSIPRSHFSSLARLDQDRLSAMLAENLCSEETLEQTSGGARTPLSGDVSLPQQEPERQHAVRTRQDRNILQLEGPGVRGVYVWGNHSPTMWPDVSGAEAKIDGRWVPLQTALQRDGGLPNGTGLLSPAREDGTAPDLDSAWHDWISETLVPAVRERGTKVIEARGKSSALSAANAIANHLKDWLHSSTSGTHAGVSMGVFSDGNPYGVPDDVVFSFPVECGEGRHRILNGFRPDMAMLDESAKELLEERREALETLRESERQALS
ncbi:conserved unknown protein [Ectocarpus siliculosus]|uniref:malate dehydrogenase n=1 Tax=Ectocarpus siliculosus TaxID=2880 RepID=D7FYH6_ECTSI|nr:conserved unknown protein [Ectocarpus siliculosus]|eukprot:CBJ32518.1 conserved unknown protein [Ectocarpus siliculosus]